jgi:hypothetical protein
VAIRGSVATAAEISVGFPTTQLLEPRSQSFDHALCGFVRDQLIQFPLNDLIIVTSLQSKSTERRRFQHYLRLMAEFYQ